METNFRFKNHVYIVKNRGEDICHYSSKEIINNVGITANGLKLNVIITSNE